MAGGREGGREGGGEGGGEGEGEGERERDSPLDFSVRDGLAKYKGRYAGGLDRALTLPRVDTQTLITIKTRHAIYIMRHYE